MAERGRAGSSGRGSSKFWAQGRGMTLGGKVTSSPMSGSGTASGVSGKIAREGGAGVQSVNASSGGQGDTAGVLYMVLQMLRDTECRESAEVLRAEAERHGLFGETCDWTGKKRQKTANDFAKLAPHVTGSHLMRLVQSRVVGGGSTGGESVSVLFRKLSSGDSSISSMISSIGIRDPTRRAINEIGLQRASETGLRLPLRSTWRPYIYHRIDGRRSIMGHFCPVYCLVFDRTGLQIITGSDDKLVKIWNTRTQRLYRTLRGHVSDIVDLAVSGDNRFLASASNDNDIRIWWLHSGVPVLVLPGHEKTISRISFCTTLNVDLSHSLISISLDGTTRVWKIGSGGEFVGSKVYSTTEHVQGARAQRDVVGVNSIALSPNGLWIGTGCTDGVIRIYSVSGRLKFPVKLQGHNKAVEQLQFNPNGDKLVSGAADGTARLWHMDCHLRLERQTVLHLRQGESAVPVSRGGAQSALVPVVKMAVWTCDGDKVVTSQGFEKKNKAGSLDVRIKVWRAEDGLLLHTFADHTQPVYVLSPHPKDPRIVMSAGYDAQVFLWDLEAGSKVRSFQIAFPSDDRLQPYDFDDKSREVLDGHFHPDGMSFSVSHKNGFITIFSANTPLRVPTEQFFQTDFGDLVMDQHRNVIDRQAQLPPHQMPHGMMTDRFQHPYDEQNMFHREQFVPVLVSASVARHTSRFEEDDVLVVSDGENDRDFLVESSDSSVESEEEMELSDDGNVDGDEDDDDDEYTMDRRKSRSSRTRETQRSQRSERVQRRRQRITESADEDDGNESEVSDSDLLSPKKLDIGTLKSANKSKPGHSVSALKVNAKRSREWLQLSEPPRHIDDDYIPQVGDTVVYFHQGHLACLQGGFADESSYFPLTDFPSMKSTETCKVLSVNYQFPAPNEDEEHSIFCVLLLQLLPEGRHDEDFRHDGTFRTGDRVRARWKGKYRFPGVVEACNGDNTYAVKFDDGDFERRQPASQMEYQTFSVSYRKTHLAEFVIPQYRFERNIGNAQHLNGDRFSMWFAGGSNQTYQGTIRAVRALDTDFPDSDWQRLIVAWDDAEGDDEGEYEGLERLSRWEIMPEGEEIKAPAILSTFPDSERERIVAGLKVVIESPTAEPFALPVDTRVYSDYLSHIPLPMDLSHILRRLEHEYYRSPEALQNDFELINRNVRIFNKAGSAIFELSKKLSPILTRLVKNDDWMGALRQVGGESKASPDAKSKSGNLDDEMEQDVVLQTWQARAAKALHKFHKFNGSYIAQLIRVPSQLNSTISVHVREFLQSDKYRGIMYSSLGESLDGGLYKSLGHFSFEFLLMCCCGVLVNARSGSKVYKQAVKIIGDALSLLHSVLKRTAHIAEVAKSLKDCPAGSGSEEVCGGSSLVEEAIEEASAILLHPPGITGDKPETESMSKVPAVGGDAGANKDEQIAAVLAGLCELDKDCIFQSPVSLEKYPDYAKFVLSPMDFSSMAAKNLHNEYASIDEMAFDFLLICSNAIIYNHHTTHVHHKATEMLVSGLQLLHGKVHHVASCEKVSVQENNALIRDDGKGKAIIRFAYKAAAVQSRSEHENVQGESSKSGMGSAKGEKSILGGQSSSSSGSRVSSEIKEMRVFLSKVLASLRACDRVGLFWDPVTSEIAADYHEIIPCPMDISSMEGKIRAGEYDKCPQLFVRDMLLISIDALVYNSLGDEISLKALEMAKKGLTACADRLIEWNTVLASTLEHATVSRAISEQRGLMEEIERLDSNSFFSEPVAGIPEYGTFVKVPMDMQTMRGKLEAGMYTQVELFQMDALLIAIDCCIFNKADTPWHKAAVAFARGLLDLFFPRSSKSGGWAPKEGLIIKVGGSKSSSPGLPKSSKMSSQTSNNQGGNDASGSHDTRTAQSASKRSRKAPARESEDDGVLEAPRRSKKRSKLEEDDDEEEACDPGCGGGRNSSGKERLKDDDDEDQDTHTKGAKSMGKKASSRGAANRVVVDQSGDDYERQASSVGSKRSSRGADSRTIERSDESEDDYAFVPKKSARDGKRGRRGEGSRGGEDDGESEDDYVPNKSARGRRRSSRGGASRGGEDNDESEDDFVPKRSARGSRGSRGGSSRSRGKTAVSSEDEEEEDWQESSSD